MADEKVLKPKSFRIDDETASRFKEISNNIGGNQQETLAKLIEAYEFQAGKLILTEKKDDIQQFEKYISILTRMYMSSLEDNQNITETVRTEFEALLQSKDRVIQDLQAQLTTAKQAKEQATNQAKTFSDEINNLKNSIEDYRSRISDLQSMLNDKDDLNKALTDSCNTLRIRVDSMAAEHEEFLVIQKDLTDMVKKCRTLEALNNEQEKNIADLKKHEIDALNRIKEQMQLECDKKTLELEKKYQEQLQTLKEQKQAEIDKYQQKLFEMMSEIKGKIEL